MSVLLPFCVRSPYSQLLASLPDPCVQGDPKNALMSFCESEDIELLVMGTRSGGKIRKKLRWGIVPAGDGLGEELVQCDVCTAADSWFVATHAQLRLHAGSTHSCVCVLAAGRCNASRPGRRSRRTPTSTPIPPHPPPQFHPTPTPSAAAAACRAT